MPARWRFTASAGRNEPVKLFFASVTSKSARESQPRRSGPVVADIAAEIGRVVRVDRRPQALLSMRLIGWCHVAHDAQLEVRERADGQRHALADQPLDQRRILERAVAVVDAVDVQEVERLPDVVGRSLLAGMGDPLQPALAAAAKTRANL